LHTIYNRLYIAYWIQIQWISIVFLFNSNVLFKYNEWINFLSQHSICIFSIHLFLDNAYGTIILQASPSKYLIEHECVKNYISLNMNMLKITNDVLWWILCPSKYLIEHERVKNYILLNMNMLKITNDVLWWILC
jgi:hypothetical protein